MTRYVGLCSRTGSAVAVAVADLSLAGRWSLNLTVEGVPPQVFHAAAELTPPDAEALVRRAVQAVDEAATRELRDLLTELGGAAGVGIVVGDHPVPESLAAIVASHPLMHAAEGQLYRDALLDAATVLGRPAVSVPRRRAEARLAGDLAGRIRTLGKDAGPPWRKEQKLAAVAALVAGRE
jgi:hypothetical protein